MLRSRVGIAAVAALFVLPPPPSDPIGVYAIIDRIVLEPDTISPERIQIWGSFVMQRGFAYYQRGRGYLYYRVNASNPRATFNEWSDLRTLAGTRRIVAFGMWYQNGRLRADSARVAEPDVYPLGTGIYRDYTASSTIAQWLRELHSAPPVPPNGPPPSGEPRIHGPSLPAERSHGMEHSALAEAPRDPGGFVRLSVAGSHLALTAVADFPNAAAAPSDPIGVYGIIDRVVLEPDSVSPERIQLWGAFVVQRGPGQYMRARGYLYYEANPENRRATFTEWSDLRTFAGRRRIVGFGSRWGSNGRIRAEADRVTEPDIYPLGTGVYRDIAENWWISQWLRELHAAPRVPPALPPGDAGSR